MAQAGQANSGDKLYSELEMNQIISDEKAPLEQALNDMQNMLNDVPNQIEAAKNEAVLELKAALKAQYESQQVAESQSETGFKSLLE